MATVATRTAQRTLVCASAQMQRIVESAQRAGASDAKVLITGESGVGKDVVARDVHVTLGRARRRRFVAVNCAGFPETLLESELFGHVNGSFTGAYRDKAGKLQLAAPRHAVSRRSRRDEPAHAGAAAALPRERRDSADRGTAARGGSMSA